MGNKNLTLIKAAGVQTGEQEPNVEQQEEGLANSEQQASEGELSGNCCINCSNLLQLLIFITCQSPKCGCVQNTAAVHQGVIGGCCQVCLECIVVNIFEVVIL